MKLHIMNLIQTDIRLFRLTEHLNRLGFHTDVFGTNHIYTILFLMGVDDSEEVVDTYYSMVGSGVDLSEEADLKLSEQIFNFVARNMV